VCLLMTLSFIIKNCLFYLIDSVRKVSVCSNERVIDDGLGLLYLFS